MGSVGGSHAGGTDHKEHTVMNAHARVVVRVVVHLHVRPETRTALRLVAAARGVSVAEVVAHWAESEARSLGLDRAALAEGGAR